jgi:hypothetical protein
MLVDNINTIGASHAGLRTNRLHFEFAGRSQFIAKRAYTTSCGYSFPTMSIIASGDWNSRGTILIEPAQH